METRGARVPSLEREREKDLLMSLLGVEKECGGDADALETRESSRAPFRVACLSTSVATLPKKKKKSEGGRVCKMKTRQGVRNRAWWLAELCWHLLESLSCTGACRS